MEAVVKALEEATPEIQEEVATEEEREDSSSAPDAGGEVERLEVKDVPAPSRPRWPRVRGDLSRPWFTKSRPAESHPPLPRVRGS